jgi:hypothetical protein
MADRRAGSSSGRAIGRAGSIEIDDSEESSPDNSDIALRASDSRSARATACGVQARSSSLKEAQRIGADPITAR